MKIACLAAGPKWTPRLATAPNFGPKPPVVEYARRHSSDNRAHESATRRVACTATAGSGGTGGTGGSGGHGGGAGGSGNGGAGGSPSPGNGGSSHIPLVLVLSVAAADLCKAQQATVRPSRQASSSDGWLFGLSAALLGMGLAAIAATAAAGQAQQVAGSDTSASQQEVAPPGADSESSARDKELPNALDAGAPSVPRRIVLFIEPSPFTYMSGYQTRFLATIKEMVAAGCQVLVITPGRGAAGLLPGGAPQPAEFAGARVVEAGSFPCPGYGTVPLSLGLSPRIFNEVRAWRPELIHVTSPGALPVAAWVYSRLLRVPLVASYHTHVPSYLPKLGLGWLVGSTWGLIRAIHRSAHLTIAVSPDTATDLVGAGACDPQTVKVWPKAVDCDTFNPTHASPGMRRRLAGVSSSGGGGASSSGEECGSRGGCTGPLLLYVGRISPEKNLQLLQPVLQQLPGAALAIVGDGPAKADMEAHFEGTNTVFLGALRGRELAEAYASADVFVMPSETETLGNVVGEAMASGLPVVAAAAGGVPSVIGRPGETGVLFTPGDADAAAAAIRKLMSDPKIRRSMSRAARAEMERWSWRQATQEILQRHYPAAVAANTRQEAWFRQATRALVWY